MNNRFILCVEDNIQVQMYNKPLLEDEGFTVKLAMTIREARETIAEKTPDLIILDIRLPDGSGLDFLRELRKTSNVPVIALTNNKEEQDIVDGLASGCDDYIPKPYSFSVLIARIEAVLRRAVSVPETLTKGSLTLKTTSMTAFMDGVDILLTQKEFALLLLFAQNENHLMTAEYIYESVWGKPMGENANAIKKAISKLRKKLSGCGYTISNEYGGEYRFERGEP